MLNRRTFMKTATSASALLALTACSEKFKVYSGAPVTAIVVYKERRKMFMINDNAVLKDYEFDLGFNPVGHKQVEGDGRTPEGAYYIDRKNPNSQFHLSLGISYPNARDRAKAWSMGKSPGGDIFIHGTPDHHVGNPDWTWGCLAVSNREMEQIYAMVSVGTPIYIYP